MKYGTDPTGKGMNCFLLEYYYFPLGIGGIFENTTVFSWSYLDLLGETWCFNEIFHRSTVVHNTFTWNSLRSKRPTASCLDARCQIHML